MNDAVECVVMHVEDALPYHLLPAGPALKQWMQWVFAEIVGQDHHEWRALSRSDEFRRLLDDNFERQTARAQEHFGREDYPRHAAETLRVIQKLLPGSAPVFSRNCPLNDGEDLTRLLEIRLGSGHAFRLTSWNEKWLRGVLDGQEYDLRFSDAKGRELTLKQLGENLLRPESSGGRAPYYLQYGENGAWSARMEVAAGIGIVDALLEARRQHGRMVISQSCGIRNPQRDTEGLLEDGFLEDMASVRRLEDENTLLVRAAGNHFKDPHDNHYNTGQTGVRAAILANAIAVGVGNAHYMYEQSTPSLNATDFCTDPAHSGWVQSSYAAPRVAALNAFLMDEFPDIPSQYIKLAQLLSCRAYHDAEPNAAGLKWDVRSGAGYLEVPQGKHEELDKDRVRRMPYYQLLWQWRDASRRPEFSGIGFAGIEHEQAVLLGRCYDGETGFHSLDFATSADVNPLNVAFWVKVTDKNGNPAAGNQVEIWLESPSGTLLLFKGTHTEAAYGQFNSSGFAMESSQYDAEGNERSWTLHIKAPEHCRIAASLDVCGMNRARDISQELNPLAQSIMIGAA